MAVRWMCERWEDPTVVPPPKAPQKPSSEPHFEPGRKLMSSCGPE